MLVEAGCMVHSKALLLGDASSFLASTAAFCFVSVGLYLLGAWSSFTCWIFLYTRIHTPYLRASQMIEGCTLALRLQFSRMGTCSLQPAMLNLFWMPLAFFIAIL
jgi:hypothetical protein